jgi:hypothetical protein
VRALGRVMTTARTTDNQPLSTDTATPPYVQCRAAVPRRCVAAVRRAHLGPTNPRRESNSAVPPPSPLRYATPSVTSERSAELRSQPEFFTDGATTETSPTAVDAAWKQFVTRLRETRQGDEGNTRGRNAAVAENAAFLNPPSERHVRRNGRALRGPAWRAETPRRVARLTLVLQRMLTGDALRHRTRVACQRQSRLAYVGSRDCVARTRRWHGTSTADTRTLHRPCPPFLFFRFQHVACFC